jgi:hypothetical protein
VTEPQPVMAQQEQDQLTRQVGRALLTVAGADWQKVRAEYRSAGRHIEVDVYVTGPDGTERLVRPPQEVVAGLGRLRQGMYRPGRGTWFSALYELAPPSAFSAEFEPDVEPRWRRVPPPIGFADELRFFPRADEHIPDWLRQRAGLPPLEQKPEQHAEPQPAPSQQAGQPGPGHAINAPGAQAAPAPMGGPPSPPSGTPAPQGQRTPPPGFPNPYQQGAQPTPAPGFNRPPAPTQPPATPTPPPGMPQPPNTAAPEDDWFDQPIDPPPPSRTRGFGVPATPYQQDQR